MKESHFSTTWPAKFFYFHWINTMFLLHSLIKAIVILHNMVSNFSKVDKVVDNIKHYISVVKPEVADVLFLFKAAKCMLKHKADIIIDKWLNKKVECYTLYTDKCANQITRQMLMTY